MVPWRSNPLEKPESTFSSHPAKTLTRAEQLEHAKLAGWLVGMALCVAEETGWLAGFLAWLGRLAGLAWLRFLAWWAGGKGW